MRSLRKNLFISLLIWVVMALAAWPVYVVVNFAIGYFMGECTVLDLLNQEPKRNILVSYREGFIGSAVFAGILGLVAVIDYQLLSRNRLTGYFAGIFVPIYCVALAFIFYKNPNDVLVGFALTGLVMWFLYKIIDIGFRIRRTG